MVIGRVTSIVAAATLFFCMATATTAAAVPNVVDQYTEQVPTPGGEQPATATPPTPDAGDPADGTSDGSGVPDGSTDQPVQGAAAPGSGGNGGGPDDGVTSTDRSAGESGSAGPSASKESSDSEGLGWLFPVLLVACLLAAVAAYLVRRHGTDRQRTT